MKKIILDTNAYIRLLAGEDRVLDALANADMIYVPIVVVGELYAGFKGGRREAENRRMLNEFLQRPRVQIVLVTLKTAEVFGETKHRLKTAGTPIPINDVWIASQAVETGAFLISFDEHFLTVPGLLLWPVLTEKKE